MRKLPVFLLLDTSGSMTGEPIESVKDGVQKLVEGLRQNPQAIETVYLSVITFDSSAKQVIPLTDLSSFQMVELDAGGGTQLGDALKLLKERIDAEVTKTTQKTKGDWKPLVFIMTDGSPNDDWEAGYNEYKNANVHITVACAAGHGADTSILKQITPNVVALDTADSASISSFFAWVTASISTSSEKVEKEGQEINLEKGEPPSQLDSELPAPPSELNIVV